jgi:hypothetical protein
MLTSQCFPLNMYEVSPSGSGIILNFSEYRTFRNMKIQKGIFPSRISLKTQHGICRRMILCVNTIYLIDFDDNLRV